MLINVGLMKDGILEPIFQERLYQLGEWLDINGEAIYNTSPWFTQNDRYNKDVWYTCTKEDYNYHNPVDVPRESDIVTAVYLIFLNWPANNTIMVSDVGYHFPRGLYEVSFLDTESHKNLIVSIIICQRNTPIIWSQTTDFPGL